MDGVIPIDRARRRRGWRAVDGPIPRAYAVNDALQRACGCGAEPGQACIGPGGVLRRIPCVARLRAAARAGGEVLEARARAAQ